jgi:hypothetical protein
LGWFRPAKTGWDGSEEIAATDIADVTNSLRETFRESAMGFLLLDARPVLGRRSAWLLARNLQDDGLNYSAEAAIVYSLHHAWILHQSNQCASSNHRCGKHVSRQPPYVEVR